MVLLACVCLCVRLDAAGVPLPPGAVRTLIGSVGRLPEGDYRTAKFLPVGRNVLVLGKVSILVDPVLGRVIDPDITRLAERPRLPAAVGSAIVPPQLMVWPGRTVLAGGRDELLFAEADDSVRLAGGGSFKLMPGMGQFTVGPDGRVAAVVEDTVRRYSIDETRHQVFAFDPKTGARTPFAIPEAGPVLGLAFTPDGRTLRVAHGKLTISHFDAVTGKPERETEYADVGRIYSIGFSPDGKTAAGWAISGKDSQAPIRLLRFDPGAKAGVKLGEGLGGDAVPYFTPDGKRLWAYDTNRWRGFEAATGKEFAGTVWCFPGCLTADGSRLLAVSDGGAMSVFDAADGKLLVAPDLPDLPVGLACRSDNKLVALTGFRTMVFDLGTGAKIAEYPANGRAPESVSPDGERVAEVYGEKQPQSAVLNTRTGERTVLNAGSSAAYVFKFPAGPGVFGRENSAIFRWSNAASEPRRFPFKGEFLALSADGKWAVSRAAEEPLWSFTETANARLSLPPGLDRVEAAAFLPDGRALAAGGPEKADGGRLMLFEPGEKREVWLVKLDPEYLARTVAVSPDGFAAAVGYDKRDTQIVEVATGRVRQTLPTVASTVAFGPLGHSLIAGHRDTPIRVWDLWGDLDPPPNYDSATIKELLGHADPARALPAMRALARGGDPALESLIKILPPRRALTESEIAALIKDLDAPAFGVREAAQKKLRSEAAAAFPALKQAAATTKSAEVRQKAETLLKVDVRIPAGDPLRRLRAAEAAMWAGTPAALKLADAWKR